MGNALGYFLDYLSDWTAGNPTLIDLIQAFTEKSVA
jgi:hypothetical protein